MACCHVLSLLSIWRKRNVITFGRIDLLMMRLRSLFPISLFYEMRVIGGFSSLSSEFLDLCNFDFSFIFMFLFHSFVWMNLYYISKKWIYKWKMNTRPLIKFALCSTFLERRWFSLDWRSHRNVQTSFLTWRNQLRNPFT